MEIWHFEKIEVRDAAFKKAGNWLDEQPKVPIEKPKGK